MTMATKLFRIMTNGFRDLQSFCYGDKPHMTAMFLRDQFFSFFFRGSPKNNPVKFG